MIIKNYSKPYFENFYPGFFWILLLLQVFMTYFLVNFTVSLNHSASNFLPWNLFDALVMWLEHRVSTQTIQVRIPAVLNLFCLCKKHSPLGDFEPQSFWSEVWRIIHLATESEGPQARKIVKICFILFRYLVTSAWYRE